MTPEEIARLRALCEAAASGPWVHERRNEGTVHGRDCVSTSAGACIADDVLGADDAAFIAAARVALPRLLDEREAKAVRDAAWAVEVNLLVRERAVAREQVADALDALPEDIRIAADGDLVRGIEGLETSYRVVQAEAEALRARVIRAAEATEIGDSRAAEQRTAHLKADAEWQLATGCGSPDDASSFLSDINDAIPDEFLDMGNGCHVAGVRELADAWRTERKAVQDHAAEIVRLRDALARFLLGEPVAPTGSGWIPPEEWHYTLGDSPGSENWSDAFDTCEEAIDDAREFHGPGVSFRVAKGAEPDPARFVPSYRDVLETMSEAAFSVGAEDPFTWPEPDEAAAAEYLKFMEGWARRHYPPTWWEMIGDAEVIPA